MASLILPIISAVAGLASAGSQVSKAVSEHKEASEEQKQTKELHQGLTDIENLLKQEQASKYQIGRQNIISRYTPKISADKKLGTPMTNAEVQEALSHNTPSTSVYTIGNIEGGSDSVEQHFGWNDPPPYGYGVSLVANPTNAMDQKIIQSVTRNNDAIMYQLNGGNYRSKYNKYNNALNHTRVPRNPPDAVNPVGLKGINKKSRLQANRLLSFPYNHDRLQYQQDQLLNNIDIRKLSGKPITAK